jgi:hypothetical protein
MIVQVDGPEPSRKGRLRKNLKYAAVPIVFIAQEPQRLRDMREIAVFVPKRACFARPVSGFPVNMHPIDIIYYIYGIMIFRNLNSNSSKISKPQTNRRPRKIFTRKIVSAYTL